MIWLLLLSSCFSLFSGVFSFLPLYAKNKNPEEVGGCPLLFISGNEWKALAASVDLLILSYGSVPHLRWGRKDRVGLNPDTHLFSGAWGGRPAPHPVFATWHWDISLYCFSLVCLALPLLWFVVYNHSNLSLLKLHCIKSWKICWRLWTALPWLYYLYSDS